MRPDAVDTLGGVEGELSQRLRECVADRFADLSPEFDEASSRLVRIVAPSGGVGDVVVESDADVGFIVYVGDFTHGHFDDGDVVARCCDFLGDLISDKVVVYNSTAGGGWFYVTHTPPVLPDAEMRTWSGRWLP
jgi:hypothetical protein